MKKPSRTREWLLVLFFVGVLAFNPPLLSIFAIDHLIFGVPVLYVYLFVAWAVLIALVSLTSERTEPKRPPGPRAEPKPSSSNER